MTAQVKNDMHRKLNCTFQCSHSTSWTFLDKLIKEENNIHSDFITSSIMLIFF